MDPSQHDHHELEDPIEVSSYEDYEHIKAKERASVLWLLSKAFNQSVPDDILDPYYRDREGEDRLRPQVVTGLASAELYCMALANIYSDPNYQVLNHHGVMQVLSRKGVFLPPESTSASGTGGGGPDSSQVSLTETSLSQTAPLRMACHLIIIESLQTLFIKEVLIVDKILEVVQTFVPDDIPNAAPVIRPDEPLPTDAEEAALFWINHACQVMREHIAAEVGKEEGNWPPLPRLEDLADISDGCSLATLVAFYTPELLPWEQISYSDSMSMADSIINLQMVRSVTAHQLPYNICFLSLEDFLYLHPSIRVNVLAYLADLMFVFEILPLRNPAAPHDLHPLTVPDHHHHHHQYHANVSRKAINQSHQHHAQRQHVQEFENSDQEAGADQDQDQDHGPDDGLARYFGAMEMQANDYEESPPEILMVSNQLNHHHDNQNSTQQARPHYSPAVAGSGSGTGRQEQSPVNVVQSSNKYVSTISIRSSQNNNNHNNSHAQQSIIPNQSAINNGATFNGRQHNNNSSVHHGNSAAPPPLPRQPPPTMSTTTTSSGSNGPVPASRSRPKFLGTDQLDRSAPPTNDPAQHCYEEISNLEEDEEELIGQNEYAVPGGDDHDQSGDHGPESLMSIRLRLDEKRKQLEQNRVKSQQWKRNEREEIGKEAFLRAVQHQKGVNQSGSTTGQMGHDRDSVTPTNGFTRDQHPQNGTLPAAGQQPNNINTSSGSASGQFYLHDTSNSPGHGVGNVPYGKSSAVELRPSPSHHLNASRNGNVNANVNMNVNMPMESDLNYLSNHHLKSNHQHDHHLHGNNLRDPVPVNHTHHLNQAQQNNHHSQNQYAEPFTLFPQNANTSGGGSSVGNNSPKTNATFNRSGGPGQGPGQGQRPAGVRQNTSSAFHIYDDPNYGSPPSPMSNNNTNNNNSDSNQASNPSTLNRPGQGYTCGGNALADLNPDDIPIAVGKQQQKRGFFIALDDLDPAAAASSSSSPPSKSRQSNNNHDTSNRPPQSISFNNYDEIPIRPAKSNAYQYENEPPVVAQTTGQDVTPSAVKMRPKPPRKPSETAKVEAESRRRSDLASLAFKPIDMTPDGSGPGSGPLTSLTSVQKRATPAGGRGTGVGFVITDGDDMLDLDLDPTSEIEMAKKKELMIIQSLRRKAQLEAKRLAKNAEITRLREEEARRRDNSERKRDEERIRRQMILEQYRIKKQREEMEKNGSGFGGGFDRSSGSGSGNNNSSAKETSFMFMGLGGNGRSSSTVNLSKNRPNSGSQQQRQTSDGHPHGSPSSSAGISDLAVGRFTGPQRASRPKSIHQYTSLNWRAGGPGPGPGSGSGHGLPLPRPSSSAASTSGRGSNGNPPSESGTTGTTGTGGSGGGGGGASSTFGGEYTGPKLFVKPTAKSNRGIIINALNVVLAGSVNAETKQKVLTEINGSDSKHFLILFRGAGLQFRSIYTYNPDSADYDEEVTRLFGMGPKYITNEMIDQFYKYNSGTKSFSIIQTKHLTVTIDAITIHSQLWKRR